MEVLKELPLPDHPNLIQSFAHGADAAIYRLNEEMALVFSADFFTPVVDDPYVFGQIAVANSLSDIYVAGAKPLLALNLICFPKKGLSRGILKRILQGGLDKLLEAGALLVGGHSVDDPEPKYGLAVLGIVHPDRIITNSKAQPGDLIYLTKPLGTGILATAFKGKFFTEKDEPYQEMIEVMRGLNKTISEVMVEVGIKCATDITGFGLLGHGLEMAIASNKKLRLYASKIPFLKSALYFAELGIIPEGDYENLNFCQNLVQISPEIPETIKILLADAQTSGGILLCVPKELKQTFELKCLERGIYQFYQIGEVLEGEPSLTILP